MSEQVCKPNEEAGDEKDVVEEVERIKKGGAEKYHKKLKEQNKLFVRQRLELLLDPEFQLEDGLLANCMDDTLPADGVITVTGKIHNRTVCVMANDSTVKAGSWGKRTVEKILRIQETARRLMVPLIYLVDSAGARITDQIDMFPGRRGAGRIFYNEANLSGVIPQICCLFGPSAAGGAYIPAFCDIVIMVDGNASMYLGSPRMAEMVIGEKVSLEEMGGAKMHCTVSGTGDILVKSEEEAINLTRKYITYFPQNYDGKPEPALPIEPAKPTEDITNILPKNENLPFNMYELIERLVDKDTFFEIKKLYAPEIITGMGRLDGKSVGVIANQPMVKGGVLFSESANKGARFIEMCDAFNIPLLFLADVPGFMIGTDVERNGIIRAGAKMIFAVSEATVPKVSVIVRKAYGAGLYAMAGPGYEPDSCLVLPTAMIAVMGPEAAVNAVFYNKLMQVEPEERPELVQKLREEYREDIDIYKLASELIVDAMVDPANLRKELIFRFRHYESKDPRPPRRKHGVIPM
jgi:acetyl-CoA carboxylase carboxyltransferase component